MEQYLHLKITFPELFLAISLGYVHDFAMHTNGLLYCVAYPSLSFELDEAHIVPIPCVSHKATLHLIETKGVVIKGTLIEYHEH